MIIENNLWFCLVLNKEVRNKIMMTIEKDRKKHKKIDIYIYIYIYIFIYFYIFIYIVIYYKRER